MPVVPWGASSSVALLRTQQPSIRIASRVYGQFLVSDRLALLLNLPPDCVALTNELLRRLVICANAIYRFFSRSEVGPADEAIPFEDDRKAAAVVCAFMKERGMSQSEIGRHASVPPRAVSNWLNGQNMSTGSTLLARRSILRWYEECHVSKSIKNGADVSASKSKADGVTSKKSSYEGICWDAEGNVWESFIDFKTMRLSVAKFVEEKAAAIAYDVAARMQVSDLNTEWALGVWNPLPRDNPVIILRGVITVWGAG